MDNSPKNISDNPDRPISTFNIYSKNNFLPFTVFTYAVIAITLIVFFNIAPRYGFSGDIQSRFFLTIIMLAAFFLLTILHEGAHFVFQWLFSRKMPIIGFKKGNPYSALAAKVRVTRNKFIFISLAPFIIIPLLLFVAFNFYSGFDQLVIIALAGFELASCSGDILTVNWLRKYPNTLVENVNLVNYLFTINR